MINIQFIEHSGEVHKVSVEEGESLMEAAVSNAVPGIDADCGGACACGTCHIKVASEWRDRVNQPDDSESMMLDMTPEREEGSRLACQITVNSALDGLVVELPEFQM